MKITILSLFPDIFKQVFTFSILGKAVEKRKVSFDFVNIRDFANDKHKSVDDKPYGGGPGMLLRIDVVEKAINAVKKLTNSNKEKVILLDPKAPVFNQKKAKTYAELKHLILVCGRYEGIDERIKYFIDDTISIGNYVLSGGEIPAMVITDAIVRLLPGVVSKKKSLETDSFYKNKRIAHPQYTKPRIYKGYKVPEVLISGNHQKIKNWQKKHQVLLE